ncbi:hypothetical protein Tsubulata_009066 [Turnera subulata]|uniref:NAC domain-containing protein n=1 Tax=Turnera subulata TaxID=218843 RepID=A0A9Q0JHN1_9ROSI|nr:hypothetical protein Tsubulata_009066 [Turnera subulata]
MENDHGQQEIFRTLPVGYRFSPTNEELVTYYLMNKVLGNPVPPQDVIQEIDATELYAKPPQNIVTFSSGEREWYFFVHINEDFFDESISIRIVGDGIGFWKQTHGPEKPILNSEGNAFAFKFHFTYFSGSGSNPKKTHWKMEEYRLPMEFYTAKKFMVSKEGGMGVGKTEKRDGLS